jgi:uncharacterized protein (TIGR01777 family)
MDVAVTGSTGLIGTALVDRLRAGGHRVRRLVRPGRSPGPGDVRWDPTTGDVDLEGLAGIDAVVHLAGAGVGDHRWTQSYRAQILDSRVSGTRTVVRAMAALDPRPSVLVSASAVGWYGDRGDELLTEESGPGRGFLSEVAQAWENEAHKAADAGIRVVTTRTGILLSRKGGALGRLLPLVKAGLAGPLGSGRQWWSWVTLEDQLRAVEFLLINPVSGPVNVTGPQPARQRDVVRALARAAHRPSVVPAPGFAMRIALGPMTDDMILASQRAAPAVLGRSGFEFRHDDLDAAADWVLGPG